ncbi:hypothetical protein ACTMU2_27360 [Cupriavidus basilensis]
MISRSSDGALAGALANQLYLDRTMAYTEELEARLRAATPEAVNAAIRRYVRPTGLSQVYAGDFVAFPAADGAAAGERPRRDRRHSSRGRQGGSPEWADAPASGRQNGARPLPCPVVDCIFVQYK